MVQLSDSGDFFVFLNDDIFQGLSSFYKVL